MVVPSDWKEIRLGEICEIYQPTTIGGKDFKESGEFVVYGANGPIGRYNRYNHEDPEVTVTCRGATCGTVNVTPPRVWITGNAMVVRPKAQTLSKLMLRYILQALDYSDVITGAAQPQITGAGLSPCQILVPPLKEQEAIAEALSDADAAIESLDALIAKKRDVKRATMQQLLTGRTRLPGFTADWREVSIGSFTDCKAGGTPSTSVPAYWGGNIRWMSSGELNLKRVREVSGRITQFGLENSSAQLFPANSVLIGLAGQGKTRGTAAINLVSLTTNQSIAAIFPSGRHDSKFLFYVMETKYKELRDLSDGGGGRGGLNLAIIKDVRVTVPELDEQKKISEVLWSMDDEIEALTAQVSKLRMVKEGMMQDLLTGKVRVS